MSRQNIYDHPEFSDGYLAMRDAAAGLNEAVEQPAMEALLPNVVGLRVVDLGCGDGRLARNLGANGAREVIGVEPSKRMLQRAQEDTNGGSIRFLNEFAEDVDFEAGSVDLAVSSLALHYVADLGALMMTIASWLRPRGCLVVTMEHPIMTAAGGRVTDAGVLVDEYASEGQRSTRWFVPGVVKYHRTFESIVSSVIGSGLVLEELREPFPSAVAVTRQPSLALHLRRPALLAIRARKAA